jgi:hypothetical protein
MGAAVWVPARSIWVTFQVNKCYYCISATSVALNECQLQTSKQICCKVLEPAIVAVRVSVAAVCACSDILHPNTPKFKAHPLNNRVEHPRRVSPGYGDHSSANLALATTPQYEKMYPTFQQQSSICFCIRSELLLLRYRSQLYIEFWPVSDAALQLIMSDTSCFT